MTRNLIAQTSPKSAPDVARMSRYMQTYALLSPTAASTLITQFASGHKIIMPDVSVALDERLQWDGHGERARLIAEYGLYASAADAAEGGRSVNAPLIAKRRKALSEGFLDWGATASARADELAADLSISVAQAMATLKAENAERALPSDYQTVAQRAEGAPEMGGDMNDVFSGSAKSQSNKMSAAIDRAAGIKEGNLK